MTEHFAMKYWVVSEKNRSFDHGCFFSAEPGTTVALYVGRRVCIVSGPVIFYVLTPEQ